MSEGDVIVATFTLPEEARAACEQLKADGIHAYVISDTASSPLGRLFGLGGRAVVYVPVAEYQRAARILEETSGELPVRPDPPLEDEEDEDLWLCSLCGEPLSVELMECPACGTVREAPPEKPPPWNRPR